jgi:hypothetical protein
MILFLVVGSVAAPPRALAGPALSVMIFYLMS